jgi:hypothetical protein
MVVIFVCTLSVGDALIPPCQPGHLMWVSFISYCVVNLFNLVTTPLCNELHIELLFSAKINSGDWFAQYLPQELLVYAIYSCQLGVRAWVKLLTPLKTMAFGFDKRSLFVPYSNCLRLYQLLQ